MKCIPYKEIKDNVEVEVIPDSTFEIKLDSGYIFAMLECLDGDTVRFEMQDSIKSVQVKEDRVIMVCMPLRV